MILTACEYSDHGDIPARIVVDKYLCDSLERGLIQRMDQRAHRNYRHHSNEPAPC